jgi:hypothetical protein
MWQKNLKHVKEKLNNFFVNCTQASKNKPLKVKKLVQFGF